VRRTAADANCAAEAAEATVTSLAASRQPGTGGK
jgi:hypothetical protein